MEGIIPILRRPIKRRLEKKVRSCDDARLKTRYLIILNLADGMRPSQVARSQKVSRDTVYRVASRFRELGEAGLVDRREDNGQTKVDEVYLGVLYQVVASDPSEHGWRRPTWTREMLVDTMEAKTGVRIHLSCPCSCISGTARTTIGACFVAISTRFVAVGQGHIR
jgi:transposase